MHCLSTVMPGFMPGIHVFATLKTWMAGINPAMTLKDLVVTNEMTAINSET